MSVKGFEFLGFHVVMRWDKRYGYFPRVEIPKATVVDLRYRIKQLMRRDTTWSGLGQLKTSHFKIFTRSHTSESPPSSCDELIEIALKLRDRVDLGAEQRYRLVGIGLSNFRETEECDTQPVLFEYQQ